MEARAATRRDQASQDERGVISTIYLRTSSPVEGALSTLTADGYRKLGMGKRW